MKIKSIPIFVFIYMTLSSYAVYPQQGNDFKLNFFERADDLSYTEILKLKINDLLQYGNNFKYYDILFKGNFLIDSSNTQNYKVILLKENSSSTGAGNIEGSIIFTKKIVEINGITFNTLELEDEYSLVKFESRNYLPGESFQQTDDPSYFPMIGYIWRNKIIIDSEMLNFPEHGYNYGKILNRTITKSKLRTSQNEECHLFGQLTDGVGITFPWFNNQTVGKVFTVDGVWNRVVWFDQNMSNPYTRSYGTSGSGNAQFNNPSGIAVNGPYIYTGNGQEYDYPIFVSDYSNNRIVKFIYNMNYSNNSWGWRIKPNSFSIVKSVNNPYDIEIHNGQNGGTALNDQYDDIIWYTINNTYFKELQSTDIAGNVKNYVTQFTYGGQSYSLNPDKIAIYRSPVSAGVNVLGCIDNELHCVIFFKLNPDGTLPSNTPSSYSVWRFNEWDKLTSIQFLSTNPNLGLNAIVTYNHGDNGYVNLFKINILNGQPIANYLASSPSGFNSDNQFIKLNNIASQNGYINFFTMEEWNDNYGIRKYKAGVDTISCRATDYCRDRNDMHLTLKTTNSARIKFENAEYTNGTVWQIMPGMDVNGLITSVDGDYVSSGTSGLRIVIPGLPYVGGDAVNHKIKIKFTMCPPDEDIYTSQHKILKTFIVNMINCIPPGGGCPYVFVSDGIDFIQDNNIVHRSEFKKNVGKDIEDKYLLRIAPSFNPSDSTCQLKIKELNNDIGYFDNFKLISIDHPVGTTFGITEGNNYILYFPMNTLSPEYAEHNGKDITEELKYDSSSINAIRGEKNDYVAARFGNSKMKILESRMNDVLKNSLNGLNNSLNGIEVKKKSKSGELSNMSSSIEDSIAVLIDPSKSDRNINTNPNKDIAGNISTYDFDQQNKIEKIPFAKRQNTSPVLIIVGKDRDIDSVVSIWNSDFMISYLAVTPVYYGGYIENQLDLIEATDSVNGKVIDLLLAEEGKYADMDSANNITLKFKNTIGSVQPGFVRDYVLITNGRYENVAEVGKRLVTNNQNQNVNIPGEYRLHQNYPNPYNPVTTIKFDLPKEGLVTIEIFDILGREVYSFKELKQAGYHQINFDGKNLSSGIYFYKIEASNFIQTKRMVLIK